MIEYTVIKSKRRTLGITVKLDGSVIVRVPLGCSKKQAEQFVNEKREWIEKAQKRMIEKRAAYGMTEGDGGEAKPVFTKDDIERLKKQAKRQFPALVADIAPLIGVTYGNITIRMQKTVWGSCAANGNLNFNCLLMLLPQNLQRYVVVHELCHRKEMNHSKAFWDEVEKYQPTYKEDRKQLKLLGTRLLQ